MHGNLFSGLVLLGLTAQETTYGQIVALVTWSLTAMSATVPASQHL